MNKTAVLFSGGKDSFFALIKALASGPIERVISVSSPDGDTQLHAGPESDQRLRRAQLELLDLPFEELVIGSGESYLHELFVGLNGLIRENGIARLVTGDLWHPYTSGIGDMLAAALGVELVRPARDACPSRADGERYMESIISAGIRSIVTSVRKGDLPERFVGHEIDFAFVRELVSLGVDAAAEGGEYQSFVLSAPPMNGSIVIDEHHAGLVEGKNGKESFHRMCVDRFHVIHA